MVCSIKEHSRLDCFCIKKVKECSVTMNCTRDGFTSNGASGAIAHEMVAAGLTIGHSSLKVYKNENDKEHGKD